MRSMQGMHCLSDPALRAGWQQLQMRHEARKLRSGKLVLFARTVKLRFAVFVFLMDAAVDYSGSLRQF